MNQFTAQPGDIEFIRVVSPPAKGTPLARTPGQPKTSSSHPLRIDAVEAPGGGLIGMTFCPGKKQDDALSGPWDRDLRLDVISIVQFSATRSSDSNGRV